MQETPKYFRIDGQVIEAVEKDIRHSDLKFYKDNPRIKNLVETKFGDDPTQDQIEGLLKSMEHVKKLKQSIVVNGGLVEPIMVKDGVVLEGNSRLAAYRILAESDPANWGKIRAIVMPSDFTDAQIFSLLGTLHIIGKTPWSPFEQASYLSRRLQQSRKTITGIADELGMKAGDAKHFVQVYNMMIENDDVEPSKWSYYNELEKSPAISKANEDYPQHNVIPTLLDMIKENKFADSRELRKVGTVVRARGENSQEAISKFFSGEITINEAVELVSTENKLADLQLKADKILETLRKENEVFRGNLTDQQLKFTLSQIRQQLKYIFGE